MYPRDEATQTESTITLTPAPASLEVDTGCTIVKLTPGDSVPAIETHGLVVTYDPSCGMLTTTGDAKVTYTVEDGVLKLTVTPSPTALADSFAQVALAGLSNVLGSRSNRGSVFSGMLNDDSSLGSILGNDDSLLGGLGGYGRRWSKG